MLIFSSDGIQTGLGGEPDGSAKKRTLDVLVSASIEGDGLEELLLGALLHFPEVLVGQHGGFSAAGGAHKVALLDEIWLVDLLDGAGLLAHGGGHGVQADGAALELVDDGGEDADVHVVQAVFDLPDLSEETADPVSFYLYAFVESATTAGTPTLSAAEKQTHKQHRNINRRVSLSVFVKELFLNYQHDRKGMA